MRIVTLRLKVNIEKKPYLIVFLTGVSTAGRASSAMNVKFFPDAFMAPATSPGSATVRGTGAASGVKKVCTLCFLVVLKK